MKLLKFEQDMCNPCKQSGKLLDEKGVKYESINIFEDPAQIDKHDIRSVPTFILLDDSGEELERQVGYKQKELEKLIEKLK